MSTFHKNITFILINIIILSNSAIWQIIDPNFPTLFILRFHIELVSNSWKPKHFKSSANAKRIIMRITTNIQKLHQEKSVCRLPYVYVYISTGLKPYTGGILLLLIYLYHSSVSVYLATYGFRWVWILASYKTLIYMHAYMHARQRANHNWQKWRNNFGGGGALLYQGLID